MQDYQTEHHEQLGGGAAFAAHADDGSGTTVRVVPITEGERTIGHRKNGDDAPAIWDRSTLKDAVEQGTLDGTLIVKGEGGSNPHFPMDEQVPPENILGRIDRWDYEDGTGPVGYAQLADEEIADRIGLGLLEVSGDWLRRLGEYDQERGGKPVSEIVDLPRVHVLERGASQGASIEMAPETAEALGYNPDAPDVNEAGAAGVETQEHRSDDDANDDAAVAQHASEGDAVRWESTSGGSREPANERYGVVVNPAPDDSDRDWMVAIYQPTADYDGWEPRDETEPMSDDSLERLGPDGVGSLPPVSQVVEQDAGLIDRLASRVADILGGDASGSDVVDVVEQQAEATITTPTYSGTEENSWDRPTFEDFDEDFSAARESATIDRNDSGEENFNDLGLFVVSPSSGSLNLAGLRAANSRAPQTNGLSDDQVSQLQSMYARLADEEFDVDWESEQDADTSGAGDGDGDADGDADAQSNDPGEKSGEENASVEQNGDESAEPDTSGADADTTDNSTMNDDSDLREQLANVKTEKEQLASEKSTLEEQLAEKEDEAETLEEQLSQKESTIEEKEERIESLETEVSPLKEMLAEIAAGDSMLDPQRIADTHSTEELVDMLADDEEAGDTSADYTEKVKEQLAATFEPRGDAGSEVGEEKNLDEQQAAEVEQLAEKVMTAKDWKQSQDFSSNREYIKTTKGVDPANVSSEVELRQKIQNNANADGGE